MPNHRLRRVRLPFPAASGLLIAGSGCVTWHAEWETTGSATASWELFDNSSSATQHIMPVTLSAGQSTRDFIGLHCLPFLSGLYYNLVSGSIHGVIMAYVDHNCEDFLETAYHSQRAQIGETQLLALGLLGPGQ